MRLFSILIASRLKVNEADSGGAGGGGEGNLASPRQSGALAAGSIRIGDIDDGEEDIEI
jgi:hypothetical protein